MYTSNTQKGRLQLCLDEKHLVVVPEAHVFTQHGTHMRSRTIATSCSSRASNHTTGNDAPPSGVSTTPPFGYSLVLPSKTSLLFLPKDGALPSIQVQQPTKPAPAPPPRASEAQDGPASCTPLPRTWDFHYHLTGSQARAREAGQGPKMVTGVATGFRFSKVRRSLGRRRCATARITAGSCFAGM